MIFSIQYIPRRSWCGGADPEDQSWRSGETFAGTQREADEHVESLDRDFDYQFIHRATPALELAS